MLGGFIKQAAFTFGNVLYNMNHFKDWMNNLEFDLSSISFSFETDDTDLVFPGIDFSFDDDWEMEKAAKFAHNGYHIIAEACRVEAGYGGLDDWR